MLFPLAPCNCRSETMALNAWLVTASMKMSLTTDFSDEFGTPQASKSYSSSYRGTAQLQFQQVER